MSAQDPQAGVVQQVYANNHVEPPWSHVWAGAIFLCLLLIVIHALRGFARARREARRAEGVRIAGSALEPGDVVVKGVARRATGADESPPLIRVEIVQDGTERRVGKKGWEHTWLEVARNVDANPFYLELPGGERMRVEPGDAPLLVDALEEGQRERRERRTMVAELSVGESVIVAGKLERGFDPEGASGAAGYREAPMGWVIRPEGGRLFLSTEPLERRHHQRAQAFRRAIAWAVALTLLAVGCFSHYLARLSFGTTLEAKIEKLRRLSKRGRRGPVYSYRLNYRVEGALPSAGKRTGWFDIDEDDYQRLKDGQRMYLRFLPPRYAFATTGGSSASTHVMAIVGALIVLGLAVVLGTGPPRAWHEGLLVQVEKGRL